MEQHHSDVATCPTCSGSGDVTGKELTAAKATGLDIRDPKIAWLRRENETLRAKLAGWMKIGSALIAAAFGTKMGGFDETPPVEIVDAIDPGDHDGVIAALRDSLLGRAWRVRGSKGTGGCDYPLCRNRNDTNRTEMRDVPITQDTTADGVVTAYAGSVGRGYIALRVCAEKSGAMGTHRDTECVDWARWVQARARAGRIEVRR